MMTIMNKDVKADNGEFKVVLSYIGEGRCGDYNAADPEDYPHIRADLYKAEGTELLASVCTGENANLSVGEAKEYAQEILNRLADNNNVDAETALAMAV